jgi:uncharacterized protein
MSTRDSYPRGVPCWVDIAQEDPDAAMRFYAELFGWEFAGPGEMPGDPPGRYYVARLRARDVAGLSSRPAGAPPGPTAWTTYVAVASADEAAAAATRAGGSILAAPFDAPPAGRLAVLTDPDGALLCLWEARERQGAQLINEPGAWAMSTLSASDPERAAAFYRELFGWEAEAMAGGPVSLLRLPGFVGGEPQQPVPRDVVAVMMPSDDGRARWDVGFWVADADASVATATSLGGSVLAGPRDIPGFRHAVIADPEGAVLSVSSHARD